MTKRDLKTKKLVENNNFGLAFSISKLFFLKHNTITTLQTFKKIQDISFSK